MSAEAGLFDRADVALVANWDADGDSACERGAKDLNAQGSRPSPQVRDRDRTAQR